MVKPHLVGVFVGRMPRQWINIPNPAPITPPVQLPPPPTGLVWSSRAWVNGIAGNQLTRGIKNAKFGYGDKFDDHIQYSHAGSGGPYNVDGKGSCQINGDRSRIYFIVKNFNSVMYITFTPNWKTSEDDLSLAVRSRHNENDPTTNRFGKYGFAIGPSQYEFAREDFHNTHTKFGGGNLPQKLINGRTYQLKFECINVQGQVGLTAWINYGQGFVIVGRKLDSKPISSAMNRPLFDQMSYAWARNNGLGNVIIRDVGFQILP